MTGDRPEHERRDPLVLDVADLAVGIDGRSIVDGVTFTVARGECVALVGPSGSGKSVTARAALGLSAPGATVRAARLDIAGVDLGAAMERRPSGRRPSARALEHEWRRVRGSRVGYVGQEALGALDPLRPVGREVGDALRLHTGMTARERVERVREVLARVGLDPALATDGRLAGTLSGGMRQRALIAAAVVGEPALVIADEPTTALDARVSVTVMETLRSVQEGGAGLLLITHDIGLVAGWADRVAVMAEGTIVESGPTASILRAPKHPVTASLVAAARRSRSHTAASGRPDAARMLERTSALQGDALGKDFAGRAAVRGIDLALRPGSTLGVVGASGSGKTTLVRMLLGLEDPTTGTVRLDGEPWAPLPESGRRDRRHRVAAVVQDPGATFDERWSVERVLVDALTAGRARRTTEALGRRVDDALERVDLVPALRVRSPRTLSGGQRQRLAIARALATDPEVLLLDEPVTALDAAVQDAVLSLLERLQRETDIAMLFVSHDLDAVRRMADSVLVVHDGQVVESGEASRVLARPAHPVTAKLLTAAERLATPARAGRVLPSPVP